MPLYVADYLAGTAHLSAAEHGAYMLLIMHYWSKGGLPEDEESIRRITRLTPRQWSQSRDVLRSFFCDQWRHKRIDEELGKAIEKSKVNSANAKRRHSERIKSAERSDTHARATSQSQSQEDSVADATVPPVAAAPVYADSRHELWGEGVPILVSLGVSDSQARKMIGTWLKTTRDDAQAVLGAIQRARDNRVHNPIPWITKGLTGSANGTATHGFRTNPNSQQSGSAPVLAGVAAATERRARERSAAGQSRPLPDDSDPPGGDDSDLFRAGVGATAPR